MFDCFFQPIESIISLKETALDAMHRLGLYNIRDLLFYKPYGYNVLDINPDLSEVEQNRLIRVEVTIDAIDLAYSRGPSRVYTSNDTGNLNLVFFNPIPKFILSKLIPGKTCIVSGAVQYFNDTPQLIHPEFVFSEHALGPVEPIYHLTYGIVNKQIYNYILAAIKFIDTTFLEYDEDREFLEYILSLLGCIRVIHLIDVEPDEVIVLSREAETFLAKKELFANQISLTLLKRKEQEAPGRKFKVAAKLQTQVLNNLGFKLTPSQKEAIEQIELEQTSNSQMMKLLQGDVGSGKTIVALLTMLNVVLSGAQAALMVPTDLLSSQHYQFFIKALNATGINVELLTGKTKAKDRKIIQENLENGIINILLGTHALFQESVNFKDLGYVIIDEQHRFGVQQRLDIIAKATHPDVLVMTATPIPRSLTLTMFGDMSLSSIKKKPKNRLPIKTTITSNKNREQVILSLQKILDRGEKIYWVCPLIDQNDKTVEREDNFTYSDVTSRYETLSEAYPGQVGLLHGKKKPTDKDRLMQQFKDGEIKILVATTVIEVGIDVSDATLIVIENAEKFGLAQLHQLRGRVGRGDLQSYCVLMYDPKRFSKNGKKRLEIMRQSDDGFYIAEQDLLLRGGGEILGTKQSGEPKFYFADLSRDLDTLLEANKACKDAQLSDFLEFQVKLFDRDRQQLVKSG